MAKQASHVRFLDRFDYRVPRKTGVTMAYKAGWSGAVTRDCANKAVAAKKAERIAPPDRPRKGGGDG
ncbi:hypothetical protein ACRQ1B_28920 [Rhizobium panacihumi]|uniref:hypothetical protein n=1 Tax=Rhizobium panacihumi TaxID=2008450 RepID=UPI003D7B6975